MVLSNLKKFVSSLLLLILFLSLNSCGKPTYPGSKITDAVVKICRDEYKLKAIPRVYGKTLWLYIPLEFLVDMEGRIDKEVSSKIENAAFSIHRVLLSTDRKIDFYVLVASDVKYIGLDFIIVGYVPDIRRVRLLDISRDDYFQRVLHDFKINQDAIGDYVGKHVDFVDISLQKFLSEQIVQRIRKKFTEDKVLSKYFSVDTEFWDIQDGIFLFDIRLKKIANVIPASINANQIMLNTAAYVLKNYKYKNFIGVKLFNPLGDGSTYITKEQVYLFKK